MNIRTIISFAFGPMIAGLLGLVTIPILTWYFPQDDIGRITLLQIAINLSVMICSLSLHESYVREYNEVDDKSDLLKISIIPGFVFLVFSIIIFLMAKLLLPEISVSMSIFDFSSSFITLMLILSIIFSFFINILNHVIRMENKGIAFSIMQITPKLSFIVIAMLLLLTSVKQDFRILAASLCTSLFISFIMVMFLTKENWSKILCRKIDKQLMRKALSFSLPLVFGGIAYWGLFAIDRIFLKIYSGLADLAIYAIATTLASSINLLGSIFATLWHPIIYKWIKEGVKPEKIQEVIDFVSLAVFIIWSIMGTVAWLTPYFFPSKYREVEYLVVACASGPLLYLLSEVTVFGIGLSRKSIYSLCASVIALVTCITLNMYLIPIFGTKGAAISTIFTFVVLFILKTEFSNKLYNNLIKTKRIYLLVLIYIAYTLFYVAIQPQSNIYIHVWLLLMIIVFISYKYEMIKLLGLIKRKL